MSRWNAGRDRRRSGARGLTLGPVVLAAFFLCLSPLHTWADGPDPDTGTEVNAPAAGKQVEETGSSPAATAEKPSDQYGDVTGQEAEGVGTRIADPIEPWNRAMYHVNDKLYFWLLKPTTKAYKYAVPEGFRGLIGNFYQNIKAPVRIVNNFLQGKPHYAALELARFLVNSTVGVGGLRECATQCFGITGREADFGQTLGKYGVGTGFYIVWPLLGPSSPRDTVGWAADLALTPTFYVSSQWFSPETVGLYALDKVNYTSFHLGDYEALKAAAIDPYVAMRDAYVQYRKKAVEQ